MNAMFETTLKRTKYNMTAAQLYVGGKTGSGFNAKKEKEEAKKKCFKLSMFKHDRVMINLSLKMVKYFTCEPKLDLMMEVLKV
jgi:hypothetical protein